MSSYATPDDVAARWRPLSPSEYVVAQTLIDDASDILRVEYPDIDTRLTTGSIAASSVTRVIAGMVKRSMMNGGVEGLSAQSQTAGPFSVNNQFANPNGNLYLTAGDRLVFDPTVTRGRAKVGWLA